MAVALVKSGYKIESGVATSSLAYASNVAANNLLIVTASAYNGAGVAPLTISDSLGHTWTAVLSMTVQEIMVDDQAQISWYAIANSSAACTVTIDQAQSTADYTFAISEWSGFDAGDPFAVNAVLTGSGTSTTPATATIDPDADPSVLYAAMIDAALDVSRTEDGAWTLIGENELGATSTSLSVIYRALTSGTTTASWTIGSSTEWKCHAFAIKEASTATNAPATVASGTGTSQTAQASVKASATVASGTGTGQTAQASVKASATVASGTGTGHNATTKVSPTAAVASGTGTAHDATVSIGTFANAEATVASGTGAGSDPTTKISPSAASASATGAALTAAMGAPATVASATGTGADAATKISPTSETATATATAHNAFAFEQGQVFIRVLSGGASVEYSTLGP